MRLKSVRLPFSAGRTAAAVPDPREGHAEGRNTLRLRGNPLDPFRSPDLGTPAPRLRKRHGFSLTENELFVSGLHPAHDGLRVAQL